MEKFFSKYRFLDQTVKGVGQIMLQENRATGLFFLAGLAVGSWQCALAALMASAVGAITAKTLKFKQEEIDAGLYGFSPALVAVAMLFLYKDTTLIWGLAVAGSVLAAIIQHVFIRIKFPAYTFPFILVAWFFVFFINKYASFEPSLLIQQAYQHSPLDSIFMVTNGFGEVIFQAKPLSGLLFFVGVMVSSPVAALFALFASMLGAVVASGAGQDPLQIQMGLFGFNTVLTAIVFAGKTKRDALWVFTGTVITILIHLFLVNSQLMDAVGGVFTFPFVAGTWLTLLLQRVLNVEL